MDDKKLSHWPNNSHGKTQMNLATQYFFLIYIYLIASKIIFPYLGFLFYALSAFILCPYLLGCLSFSDLRNCLFFCLFSGASLVVQTVKNPPAIQETWVQSLGQEDPLEKGMATHSNIFAWETHGQRSLADYSPWGCQESDTTERQHFPDC